VVNNVGLARFGHIGSVDLDDLSLAYDMNVRTAVQVVQAVLPAWSMRDGPHRERHQPDDNRLRRTNCVCRREGCIGDSHSYLGRRARVVGHHRECRGARTHRDRDVRERSPVGSEREARVLERIPLQRVGTPTEIAHVICMLLHEDAGYMTGQIVRVDGGGSIGST